MATSPSPNASCWHLFHLTCVIWATFPHKRHHFGALLAKKSIILATFSSTMHHLANFLTRIHYFSTKICTSTCELKSKLENRISNENLKSTKFIHSFILFCFSFCLEPGPAECAERLNPPPLAGRVFRISKASLHNSLILPNSKALH